MDISKRPDPVMAKDFENVTLSSGIIHNFTEIDYDRMSSFPLGKVSNGCDIFICSVTCPDSANTFMRDIVPRLKSGEALIMANYVRSDEDLNIWTRIFKLKAFYRPEAINQIYQAAYHGKLKSHNDVHRFLDSYLSNVPLERVYSSYNVKLAALSALFTTASLYKNFNVIQTPATVKSKERSI
ncbi:hypothetical protein [Enterobacter mori]|uniref:hypothetical protein n=1 Tax=Enterobacter mori TaxID=539813 RepID=UPI003D6466C8